MEGIFTAYNSILHPVELIVLYISRNFFVFQPLVVLFAAITGISGNISGFLLEAVDMPGQVIN